MSRVLVGFEETAKNRFADADGDEHGFLQRLLHKSPFGAKIQYVKCLVIRPVVVRNFSKRKL